MKAAREFTGVILAAGASRRMGFPKWQAEIAGKSFLSHIVDTLAEVNITSPIVVFRRLPDLIPESIIPVINPAPEAGQLSSLKTALSLVDEHRPFFMQLVDRPLVHRSTFIRMMEEYDGSKIVIPAFEGRKGHPVLFPPGIKNVILKTDLSAGARAAIEKWRGGVNIVETCDETVLWNIDSPEDLRYYSALIERGLLRRNK